MKRFSEWYADRPTSVKVALALLVYWPVGFGALLILTFFLMGYVLPDALVSEIREGLQAGQPLNTILTWIWMGPWILLASKFGLAAAIAFAAYKIAFAGQQSDVHSRPHAEGFNTVDAYFQIEGDDTYRAVNYKTPSQPLPNRSFEDKPKRFIEPEFERKVKEILERIEREKSSNFTESS